MLVIATKMYTILWWLRNFSVSSEFLSLFYALLVAAFVFKVVLSTDSRLIALSDSPFFPDSESEDPEPELPALRLLE